MTRITKVHLALFVICIAMLVGFGGLFWARRNYEFIAYIGVVAAAIVAVSVSLRHVHYPLDCLVGLVVWAGLHLGGGAIHIGGERLYDVMIWTFSEHLHILRYDQLVHVWGFGAATLLMACLLDNNLRRPAPYRLGLVIVLVMAGLGVGAFNEIIEFIAAQFLESHGIGDYTNTSLDLVSNMVGAVLAVIYLRLRGRLA